MRVLHADSAAGWRGGQNQVLLTARGMADRGHEVLLACRAGGELEGRARAAGLETLPLRIGSDLSPRAAWSLRRALDRLRIEVAQLHDPHALGAGVLAGIGSAGTPLVATRRVDFRLRGRLSRLKYARCARVVAVSRAIAAVLAADGVPASRVRLVHEGVPDRPPRSGGEAVLRALGIPAGRRVVGNVAALVDHKDHATLIDAAARVVERLPDAHFLVLGEGPLRRELEARVRDRGLTGHWTFGGFRRDLDALLPVLDVFCLSSHMEGLGTSLLDAMCFGLPIAATAAGGIPDAIEEGVTGRLVPVRDHAALGDALLDLLSDRPAARRLAEGARRRFEERFTDAKMVEGTIRVLEEARAHARGAQSP